MRSIARRSMTMRARVLRTGSASEDKYGHPIPNKQPDVVYDSLACYAWSPTDPREVFDDAVAVAGAVRCVMPIDTDIEQGYAVEAIRDRIDRIVFDGPLEVTSVVRNGSALSVMLRTQIGGA